MKRWIEAGAEYQAHWAFQTPTKPAEPTVTDGAWAKNALDRFVLARMDGRGVKPSAEAEATTLARRVFMDLTGLPPTPEELDTFLADTAQGGGGAYERGSFCSVQRSLRVGPSTTKI